MDKLNINNILKLFVLTFFASFFLIIRPFLPSIILAIAFAIIFYPLAELLRKKLKLGEAWSAFFTVTITLIFIVLPLAILLTLITREAIHFAQNTDFQALSLALTQLTEWKFFGYTVDLSVLKEKIIASLSAVGSYTSAKGLIILSSISNSIFLFFVFLLLYYYFLKDAKLLLVQFETILPYEKPQRKSLFKAFADVSKTIFYGNVLCAMIAGGVAYIGFFIFGFKGALIWALLAAVFSFIPTLGTLLIYLIGIILLGFTTSWLAAILMSIYFICIELLLRETWIRGKILEDKLKFHPIMVFFALVGGVSAFGSLGLIYGPLIITFLGAIYQFYFHEKKTKKLS